MKSKRLTIICSVLGVVLTVFAFKPAKPPVTSDVVGTWLGFSEGRVEFFRVDFDADGMGYISISYLRNSPVGLYRIQSWKIDGRSIDVTSQPIDQDAEPITLRKVAYHYSALEIDIRGKGWQRDATLFREREFSSRATAVGERIDRLFSMRKVCRGLIPA